MLLTRGTSAVDTWHLAVEQVEQKTAFYFEEKLDMLLDRLFTDPGRRCYQGICNVLFPGASPEALRSKYHPRPDDAFARQRESLDRLLPSLRKLLYVT